MKLSKLTTAIAAATLVASTGALAIDAKVGGRGFIDYTDVSVDNGSSDTDSEDFNITDARINVSGQINEDYSYRAEVKYSDANDDSITNNDEIDYTDLYLTYHGFGKMANITVGSQKEPFGLNALASGTDTTFLNRSYTVGTVGSSSSMPIAIGENGDNRNIGVQVHGSDGLIHYGIGLFRDDVDTDSSGDDEVLWAVTGRIAVSPVNEAGNVWHFGLGYTDRDGGDNEPDVDAFNVEAAWVAGPFSAQLEYTDGSSEPQSGTDTDADGYYLNLAWTITGESRPYSGGVFGGITPEGDDVAYEVAIRFYDNTIETGTFEEETDGFAIALNAYKNEHVRVGFEYHDAETDSGSTTIEEDGFTIRTQFQF